MSRFYQTAKPQFVDDIMYRYPWEMIYKALEGQQTMYNNAINNATLLGDLTFDYIQEDPFERKKALDKKQYYSDKTEELVKKLQSANNVGWKGILPEIDALSKELRKDMLTGDISKMQYSSDFLKKWEEDTKKFKEDNPAKWEELRRANIAKWSNPEGSSGRLLDMQSPVKDLILGENVEKMKERVQVLFDKHGYKETYKGLPEESVRTAFLYDLRSDPNLKSYMLQEGGLLGKEGYFDLEGNAVPFTTWMDKQGNTLTEEQAMNRLLEAGKAASKDKNLTDEEYRVKGLATGEVFADVNPNSAFYDDYMRTLSTYSRWDMTDREMTDEKKLRV